MSRENAISDHPRTTFANTQLCVLSLRRDEHSTCVELTCSAKRQTYRLVSVASSNNSKLRSFRQGGELFLLRTTRINRVPNTPVRSADATTSAGVSQNLSTSSTGYSSNFSQVAPRPVFYGVSAAGIVTDFHPAASFRVHLRRLVCKVSEVRTRRNRTPVLSSLPVQKLWSSRTRRR